jgi:hypothetical protein
MKTIFKVKAGDSNNIGNLKHAARTRWAIPIMLLCAVLTIAALIISLLIPEQLLAGGVVTWSVVGALISGVLLAFKFS